MGENPFKALIDYLQRVPAMEGTIGSGIFDDGRSREQSSERVHAVVKGQPANALARRGDEHLAERTVEMGPANGFTASAVAPRPDGSAPQAEPFFLKLRPSACTKLHIVR